MPRGKDTRHSKNRRVGRVALTETSSGPEYVPQQSKREQKDSWSDAEYVQKTGRRILPSTNATTGEVDTGRI